MQRRWTICKKQRHWLGNQTGVVGGINVLSYVREYVACEKPSKIGMSGKETPKCGLFQCFSWVCFYLGPTNFYNIICCFGFFAIINRQCHRWIGGATTTLSIENLQAHRSTKCRVGWPRTLYCVVCKAIRWNTSLLPDSHDEHVRIEGETRRKPRISGFQLHRYIL